MRHLVQPSLESFLARLLSRSVLHAEEQQAILSLPGHLHRIKHNQDLRPVGEPGDCASLIAEGVAARFDQTREGDRQIIAFHVVGDMADLALVVQPKASLAIQALSTASVVRIPHGALRRIAARYPAIAEAFWRDVTVDASVQAQWIVNVGNRNARTRIAHLICELAVRYRASGQQYTAQFSFPATQRQLAEATGLSAVHVNRTVQGLRPQVVIAGGHVAILDWEELVRLAKFDPSYLHLDIRAEDRLRFSD